MRVTEIETLEQFDRLASGARTMSGWQLQDLDLREREDVLRTLEPAGSLFLGCELTDQTAELLRGRGALLFPRVPDVPFDPYRSRLYTATELYDGLDGGYEATPDALIYAWAGKVGARMALVDTLAQALHDHSVDDALGEYAAGRDIVGVMGGHAIERDQPAYTVAAGLGRELARTGLTVATGGGPGAMEAANLGALLADQPDETLTRALSTIARVPDYRPSVTQWARVGLAAVEGVRPADQGQGRSLGVPTWFYGHEPPNVFCARVAKYFRNAIREDVLLHLCRAGIVFLPGSAGTVQEIFQAACENYYADATSVAPMVLVGEEYWTRELPAWPLLGALAKERPIASRLHLVDRAADVLGVIADEA